MRNIHTHSHKWKKKGRKKSNWVLYIRFISKVAHTHTRKYAQWGARSPLDDARLREAVPRRRLQRWRRCRPELPFSLTGPVTQPSRQRQTGDDLPIFVFYPPLPLQLLKRKSAFTKLYYIDRTLYYKAVCVCVCVYRGYLVLGLWRGQKARPKASKTKRPERGEQRESSRFPWPCFFRVVSASDAGVCLQRCSRVCRLLNFACRFFSPRSSCWFSSLNIFSRMCVCDLILTITCIIIRNWLRASVSFCVRLIVIRCCAVQCVIFFLELSVMCDVSTGGKVVGFLCV